MKTIVILSGGLLFAGLFICASHQADASSAASSLGGSVQHAKPPGGGGGSSSSSAAATQTRQSAGSAAASLIGAIGSLVPGLITNVAPLVLLVGIGALMMPTLGMSAMGLLREARRSANDHAAPIQPTFQIPGAFGQYAFKASPNDMYYFAKRSFPSLMSGFSGPTLMRGMQDVLERVLQAIDNADKRYN